MRESSIVMRARFRWWSAGIVFWLAFILQMVHPHHTQAALLDSLTNLTENLEKPESVLSNPLPELQVQTPSLTVETPLVQVVIPPMELNVSTGSSQPVTANLPAIEVETPVIQVQTPAIDIDVPALTIPTVPVPVPVPVPIPVPEVPADTSTVPAEAPATEKAESVTPLPDTKMSLPAVEKTVRGSRHTPNPRPKTSNSDIHSSRVVSKTQRGTAPVESLGSRSSFKPKKGGRPQPASFHSIPIPSERTYPLSHSPTTLVAGSLPTGGGTSIDSGSRSSPGSPGFLYPVIPPAPPGFSDLVYRRAQSLCTSQWSKPPPVQPPRHALLLFENKREGVYALLKKRTHNAEVLLHGQFVDKLTVERSIHEKRLHLLRAVEKYGLSDPLSLRLSKELDELIIAFYSLQKED